MRTGHLGFAFEITPQKLGDTLKSVALFTCATCLTTDFIVMQSDQRLNPQGYNNTMRQRGWSVHKAKKSRIYCPACTKTPTLNDTDSELKHVKVPMLPAVPVTLESPALLAVAAPATVVSPIRPLTSDERLAIRNALDLHFDDGVGAYLEDMDDAKLAAKLGLPRIHIERLREAAYGPIRVDPETAAIRKELGDLKRMIGEARSLQDNLRRAIDDLESKAMGLGSRLERRAG